MDESHHALPWFVCLLLLSGSIAPSLQAAEPPRQSRLLVVLIGGMDSDPTTAQIEGTAPRGEGNSGMFQLQHDLTEDRVDAEYFNWNGTRAGQIRQKKPPHASAICETIRARLQAWPQDRVTIVGNSWGGHTACEVCRELHDCDAPLKIDHLVLLDPSSTGRALKKPAKLTPNVVSAVNYFTRNAFVWGPLKARGVYDVDLGDAGNGYLLTAEKAPKYDSRFSFPAHVAAEWDPRIHADIHRRLLDFRP
jgi:pimeloyl-ACP methyl ester carboxylesterase